MIDRILVRKYCSASWLLFAACGATLFSFAWVRVWVVSLLDMSQFTTILDQFRQYEKFAPIEFDALVTYSGRVGMTFDEPVVIFCIVVWCISRGSDVVAGELGRGTLEMILAQPIRRRTLMASHAAVSVAGLLGLCLLVWTGITIGIFNTTVTEAVPAPSITIPYINFQVPLAAQTDETITVPLAERVDTKLFAASVVHLFSFGFFLLGLASLASALDRYRWRAVGTVVGFYVIQLVMFGLGKATESLQWLLSLSFFSCYKPQKMTQLGNREGLSAAWDFATPLETGFLPPMVYPLILLGFGAAFYIAATIILERRDLPAPL